MLPDETITHHDEQRDHEQRDDERRDDGQKDDTRMDAGSAAVAAEQRWRDRISKRLKWLFRAEVLAAIEIGLVLPAALAYCTSADDRVRERHYQAWQVIAAWDQKPGDGGRIDALEDLNRDRVSMRGVGLARAYLDSVDLAGADMKYAHFDHASLRSADFTAAFLARATLVHADLNGARAHDADFVFANADTASFYGVTLCRTLFVGASLRHANFGAAVLDSADFRGANLRNAVFSTDALPAGSRFEGANVHGVTPEPFRLAALAGGAVEEPDSARWAARLLLTDMMMKSRWVSADSLRMIRVGDRNPSSLRCAGPPASEP